MPNHDDRGVPAVDPLSRNKIELIVNTLHREEFSHLLQEPQPAPVEALFEGVLELRYGIATGVTDVLGSDIEGAAYPATPNGRAEILLRADVYEKMLDRNPRARFTCTHECAHGILGHLRQLNQRLVDGHRLALYRRTNIPAYRNPEWQANYFAGAFLMPTKAVLAVVQEAGPDVGVVAETFQVSASAADVRLRQLAERGGIFTS